jgi:hypothetical protein
MPDHKNLKESCAFCFAQTHIGGDLSVPPTLAGPSLVTAAQNVLEDGFRSSLDRSLPPARGPPSAFS